MRETTIKYELAYRNGLLTGASMQNVKLRWAPPQISNRNHEQREKRSSQFIDS